ncbi:hypothetical protein BDU57DRAFT_444719 [Ampelomyces quisqualis]|uniref:Uncharacterized protein n=1 Tax=Ampelomyces quisqualis TaxID=50730 RepID=A0A6A5QVC0_AMPQU|nr:hypothetical protein BDU57DRAFT_444719 [Ampelomyces quisqualis]
MSAPRNQSAAARPAFAPLHEQHHFYGAMTQQTQQQPQGPQRHPSFEYRPNREGAGQTAAETTNYLSQMALLNEAAKRAQIAVVMRDMEGMEL